MNLVDSFRRAIGLLFLQLVLLFDNQSVPNSPFAREEQRLKRTLSDSPELLE
jgi:hypothetical protein